MSTRVSLGVSRVKNSGTYYARGNDVRYALRFDEMTDYGKENGELATVRDLTVEELEDLRSLIDGVLPRPETARVLEAPQLRLDGMPA